VAVLFHDTDLKRLCQIDAKVSELTFAEIQEVSLENGGKIPSLREVLVELDGAKLNIDIKAKNAILPTVQAIEETSAHFLQILWWTRPESTDQGHRCPATPAALWINHFSRSRVHPGNGQA